MKISADGFTFDFPDAIEAFVFDEKNPASPRHHKLPMKAVDIIVVLPETCLFIEMKDMHDPASYDLAAPDEATLEARRANFKWLKNYLKYKYRDTYLYRHAEERIDDAKPIHYICLLTFDNPLNGRIQKALKQELPIGKASKHWQREIARSCQVVNVACWNRNFPKWRLTQEMSNKQAQNGLITKRKMV